MAKKIYSKPTATMCKYVEGFENYIIFDDGRLFYLKTNKFIEPYYNNRGHLKVSIYNDNKKRTTFIHRLVAEAFIPNPNNLDSVHHLDRNKNNNNVENLMWISNADHMALHKNKRVINVQTGEIFESAKCASVSLGCNKKNQVATNIYRGCRTCGYNFKYLED
ncbi:MAG: HNH endonuclease [archaeon]|nr:HNH endonuclease [archaeon]